MAAGFDPTLVENEITTAATVHADLPAVLMGLCKVIHQLPLGIKKILDLQHIVKLALNFRGQPQLIDLEIAGIGCCSIPGVHCVVSKMGLEILGHFLTGPEIHGF